MAQFVFYGTWADTHKWLEMLISVHRYVFVHDIWYTEMAPRQFEELSSSTLDLIRAYPVLLLWSGAYSRVPPRFGTPTDGGLFRIDRASSGPSLGLSLPTGFTRDGRMSVGLGILDYDTQHLDAETGQWYGTPVAMREDYKQARGLLRRNMVRRYALSRLNLRPHGEPATDALWIGKDAVRLLENNEAEIRIGDRTMWYRGDELKRTLREARFLDNSANGRHAKP